MAFSSFATAAFSAAMRFLLRGQLQRLERQLDRRVRHKQHTRSELAVPVFGDKEANVTFAGTYTDAAADVQATSAGGSYRITHAAHRRCRRPHALAGVQRTGSFG